MKHYPANDWSAAGDTVSAFLGRGGGSNLAGDRKVAVAFLLAPSELDVVVGDRGQQRLVWAVCPVVSDDPECTLGAPRPRAPAALVVGELQVVMRRGSGDRPSGQPLRGWIPSSRTA